MIEAKYPINRKCLIINNDTTREMIENEFGKDINELAPNAGLFDFIDKKIGKMEFPLRPAYLVEHEYQVQKYGKENCGRAIFNTESRGGCVIEIPRSYDPKNDIADAMERKISFLEEMKRLMKAAGKKYDEELLEKNVNFGATDFSFINEILDYFYKKFEKHYVNDKLWIFLDLNDEHDNEAPLEDEMIGYPYPKAFYLSEIEKHLQDSYGLDTSELYQGIFDDMYVEGRFWERFYFHEFSTTNFKKKKYSENYITMMGLIHQDFKDFFISNDRFDEGSKVLPIFVDYRKKLDDMVA